MSVINSNYPLFLRFNPGDVSCSIHTISIILCLGRRILRVYSVYAHYLYIVCECSLFSVHTPVDMSEYKVSHTKLDSRVIKNPCERVTCNLYSGRMITWRRTCVDRCLTFYFYFMYYFEQSPCSIQHQLLADPNNALYNNIRFVLLCVCLSFRLTVCSSFVSSYCVFVFRFVLLCVRLSFVLLCVRLSFRLTVCSSFVSSYCVFVFRFVLLCVRLSFRLTVCSSFVSSYCVFVFRFIYPFVSLYASLSVRLSDTNRTRSITIEPFERLFNIVTQMSNLI